MYEGLLKFNQIKRKKRMCSVPCIVAILLSWLDPMTVAKEFELRMMLGLDPRLDSRVGGSNSLAIIVSPIALLDFEAWFVSPRLS